MYVQSNVNFLMSADRADVFFGATGINAAPLRLYTCPGRSIHVDSIVGRKFISFRMFLIFFLNCQAIIVSKV
jgi:hypothetical protein